MSTAQEKHTSSPSLIDLLKGIRVFSPRGFTQVGTMLMSHSSIVEAALKKAEAYKGLTEGLTEALKDAVALLDDSGNEDGETWQPGQSWIFRDDKIAAKNRMELMRAAILKAEGGAE